MRSMFRVMLAGLGGNGPDDEYNVGSSIDTAGTRYAGAQAWTIQNQGAATFNVAGDALTITAPSNAFAVTMDTRLATQPWPAGDGLWRIDMALTSTPANYSAAGIWMRLASSTNWEAFCLGHDNTDVMQVRGGGGYTNWTTNHISLGISSFAAQLEVERIGANIVFRYSFNGGASFTTLTTRPSFADEIGVFCNASIGAAATADFQWFRRIS